MMDMDFKEQTVIITGGTRGIGAGLSQAFLARGAKVLATYMSNHEKAQQFKASLPPEQQERLHLFAFNAGERLAVEEFFKTVDERFGAIHVLINNSGIRKDQLMAAMKEDDWDQVLQMNLKSSYLMSKEAVLRMMRTRYGRIIMMSSLSANMGLAGQTNYSASKAGQIAMMKSLAKEVAKRQITVNALLPGFIETELLEGLPPELMKKYLETIPVGRLGKVAEVAHAALFLASKQASYINGACLEVSGGLS